MIKNSVYKVSRDSKGNIETTLDAKLRFVDETAPKDKKDIKERMNISKSGGLTEYLINYEAIGNRMLNKRYYLHRKINGKIGIYKAFPKLGINIEVSFLGKIPEEKILNLEALNKFILTSS
jgi:hypothetical protein